MQHCKHVAARGWQKASKWRHFTLKILNVEVILLLHHADNRKFKTMEMLQDSKTAAASTIFEEKKLGCLFVSISKYQTNIILHPKHYMR